MMFVVLIWLFFAALVAAAAGGRGRNRGGWFALAVVISPLLAAIALALQPDLRREAMLKRQHAELIAAIRGGAIDPATVPPADPAQPEGTEPRKLISWPAYLLFCAGVIGFLYGFFWLIGHIVK
jgi:hypothetical protein